MIDQASELRKLVLRSVRQQVAHAGPAPRLIGITSGGSGVGVTTLAANLSVAFAEHGSRVVLVDADLRTHQVAALCGLPPRSFGDDPEPPSRDIHEMMQRGPAGIQVVPRLCPDDGLREWAETAQDRLLGQLQSLGRHAEIVVLDAGDGSHRFQQHYCRAADDVLLVTTNHMEAVVDTYALLKKSQPSGPTSTLRLIVNLCRGQLEAEEVHRRFDHSCRRFLGQPVPLAVAVPEDPAVPLAAARGLPFVVDQPTSQAALAVGRLAAHLLQSARGSDRRQREAA